MTAFIAPGNCEAVKGSIHGALGTLAVLCGVYNMAAWRKRNERHLAINAAVYSALAGYEVWNILRHYKASR